MKTGNMGSVLVSTWHYISLAVARELALSTVCRRRRRRGHHLDGMREFLFVFI